MKKYFVFIAVAVFSICMFGCKKHSAQESQEPMSMEAMSTINASAPAATDVKLPEQKSAVTQMPPSVPAGTEKLEPLPPSGPFKPAVKEIQAALKNANYYTGTIDGKIGPGTKKAIEEFQKANGLTPDGKVGPKTWALLSTFLNLTPTQAPSTKKR